MLAFLRKHQKALFLIVAVVGVAFFVFPDSSSTTSRLRGERGGGINVLGTQVSPEELGRIEKSGGILQQLRGDGFDFSDPMLQHLIRMSSLAARTVSVDKRDEAATNDFIVNTALCRVLAKQLGISVSEAEVDERLQQLPRFQKEGRFDPAAWKMFIDAFGGEGGERRKAIYETVTDTILFDKLFALVGQSPPPSQLEIDLAYIEDYQRISASTISLAKKDFENQEVSEEEMKKYFDDPANQPALLSEEKRGCRFVMIPRPKEEELKDLDESAKAEKLKEHKRIAAGLSEKLVAEDRGDQTFEAIAKSMGLEVTTVDPFVRSQPPEALKSRPQLVHLAFSLTEVGTSEVREVSDGYAALELSALEKPRPLTFEEAKEKIAGDLKQQKQNERFDEFVKTTREKLQSALAAGKSLAEAATEAGAPAPRELPGFSRRKPVPGEANFFAIQEAAAKTDVGALSEPVETPDGKLLVFVARKELPKDPKMEDQKKALVAQRHAGSQQPTGNPVFNAWFSKMRDLADAGLTRK